MALIGAFVAKGLRVSIFHCELLFFRSWVGHRILGLELKLEVSHKGRLLPQLIWFALKID